MHDGLCTVLYRGGSSRPSTFAQISLVIRGVPDRTSLLPSPGQLNGFQYPTQPLRRDLDLWFFDGNIVLVALDIAFRAHKSVLACHSDVFRSWITGPHAITSYGTVELFEGVQVVYLRTNDTPHDVRQALLVMYGLRHFEPAQMSFSVVASLRRISLAYGMNTLIAATTSLLDPTFSGDLKKRDAAPAERRLSFDQGERQGIESYNVIKMTLPVDGLYAGTTSADGYLEVLTD
ncbi:hypothetical protein OH76DRAFT_1422432 [Lentinus brumalis]|uniref:BTB domain-containing protein n=1 Tax=Lentinus brumalis TaxID=2498619 RepID=A0A371CQN1_9APHY|nr:hypothetical protein OH76DRAFT_1422432 [Polyporus brumalis]